MAPGGLKLALRNVKEMHVVLFILLSSGICLFCSNMCSYLALPPHALIQSYTITAKWMAYETTVIPSNGLMNPQNQSRKSS